jgi:hypothetical protein
LLFVALELATDIVYTDRALSSPRLSVQADDKYAGVVRVQGCNEVVPANDMKQVKIETILFGLTFS